MGLGYIVGRIRVLGKQWLGLKGWPYWVWKYMGGNRKDMGS